MVADCENAIHQTWKILANLSAAGMPVESAKQMTAGMLVNMKILEKVIPGSITYGNVGYTCKQTQNIMAVLLAEGMQMQSAKQVTSIILGVWVSARLQAEDPVHLIEWALDNWDLENGETVSKLKSAETSQGRTMISRPEVEIPVTNDVNSQSTGVTLGKTKNSKPEAEIIPKKP